MIFYFSGTGNTRWAAREMARLTHDTTEEMVHYMHHPELTVIDPGKPLGIFFPVYGWDAPRLVYDFLTRLQHETDACPSYLYYICTMGDDIGLTGDRVEAYVRRFGWQFQAGFSLLMPDTYVCLPSFDVDPEEERETKLAAAPERLSAIAASVDARSTGLFQLFRGKHPWLKTAVFGRLFRRILMTDSRFHTTEACTSCGRCETVCPVNNLVMHDGRPTWHHKCQMCLACYHACPHHAIRWGRQTDNKGQYVAPKNKQITD